MMTMTMTMTMTTTTTMRPAHPSHDLVLLPPGPRRNKHGRPLKETLQSKYGHVVELYLNENGVMAEVHTLPILILITLYNYIHKISSLR
jgi:hypothetical protein